MGAPPFAMLLQQVNEKVTELYVYITWKRLEVSSYFPSNSECRSQIHYHDWGNNNLQKATVNAEIKQNPNSASI